MTNLYLVELWGERFHNIQIELAKPLTFKQLLHLSASECFTRIRQINEDHKVLNDISGDTMAYDALETLQELAAAKEAARG